MPEQITLDKDKLEALMIEASSCRSAYWDALRDIEQYIGRDLDGLMDSDADICDHDAESFRETVAGELTIEWEAGDQPDQPSDGGVEEIAKLEDL